MPTGKGTRTGTGAGTTADADAIYLSDCRSYSLTHYLQDTYLDIIGVSKVHTASTFEGFDSCKPQDRQRHIKVAPNTSGAFKQAFEPLQILSHAHPYGALASSVLTSLSADVTW